MRPLRDELSLSNIAQIGPSNWRTQSIYVYDDHLCLFYTNFHTVGGGYLEGLILITIIIIISVQCMLTRQRSPMFRNVQNQAKTEHF